MNDFNINQYIITLRQLNVKWLAVIRCNFKYIILGPGQFCELEIFRQGSPDPSPIRALAVLLGPGGPLHELTFSEAAFGGEGDALPALAAALRVGGGWARSGRAWRLNPHV